MGSTFWVNSTNSVVIGASVTKELVAETEELEAILLFEDTGKFWSRQWWKIASGDWTAACQFALLLAFEEVSLPKVIPELFSWIVTWKTLPWWTVAAGNCIVDNELFEMVGVANTLLVTALANTLLLIFSGTVDDTSSVINWSFFAVFFLCDKLLR